MIELVAVANGAALLALPSLVGAAVLMPAGRAQVWALVGAVLGWPLLAARAMVDADGPDGFALMLYFGALAVVLLAGLLLRALIRWLWRRWHRSAAADR